jgi:hypothetical protein
MSKVMYLHFEFDNADPKELKQISESINDQLAQLPGVMESSAGPQASRAIGIGTVLGIAAAIAVGGSMADNVGKIVDGIKKIVDLFNQRSQQSGAAIPSPIPSPTNVQNITINNFTINIGADQFTLGDLNDAGIEKLKSLLEKH